MKRRTPILEVSPKDGIFRGDLAYGRKHGRVLTREDHVGLENDPVAPLVLIPQRDGVVWKKDPRVKEVKKNVDNSQYLKNVALGFYIQAKKKEGVYAHLTVDKQRF